MSLKVTPLPAIPAKTIEVVQAAFPQGNRYMLMRDQLGTFYGDEDFVELYATRGQPGISAWRLALVQVFAYMEDLSDERAADAVRSRIDWKYVLSRELTDQEFDAAVLSELRTRLVAGGAEALLFEKMLARLNEACYLNKRGRQRSDATHVLAAARQINRLVLVGETMRQALHVLATSAPDWLLHHMGADWLERYEKRFDDYPLPKAQTERAALASQIGEDGRTLLNALFAAETPRWLHELPAVRILHRVWLEQYPAVADDQPMVWRAMTELPPPDNAFIRPMMSTHATAPSGPLRGSATKYT